MSLGIIIKGPEGIVLAADSRVTLNREIKQKDKNFILPATFDNANKLLSISNQKYVGVVTYGVGALGHPSPRTAHSFIPEFESELQKNGESRLSIEEFAKKMSDFFVKRWKELMPSDYSGQDIIFLVGGYDKDSAYGRVFKIDIPSNPKPEEFHKGDGDFGPVWGGQMEFTNRILHGFDPKLLSIMKKKLNLSDKKIEDLGKTLLNELGIPIPFMFLSLQDCVDFSIALIRTTIAMQSFYVDIRGVGGEIDVATITRTEGFKYVQQKKISGEYE